MYRSYPLFLIDRSRSKEFPYDYIVCLEVGIGFVLRVLSFNNDKHLNMFIANTDQTTFIHDFDDGGGLVLVVEEMLYHPDWSDEVEEQINNLYQQAAEKYLEEELIFNS